MRPGEIRVRLDTDSKRTVVVLSSETFNTMTRRALVAPLHKTEQVAPGVRTEVGFVAFPLLTSVLISALSEPRGHIDPAALEETQALIAGAMTQ